MGKESKKKKNEPSDLKEVSDCTNTVHTGIEDGLELSKEDKRKKLKKKAEVSSGVEVDGSHKEHINIMDFGDADDNSQKEKEKKRKKKRKLEPVEDNDKSNKEIPTGGEDRSCLQMSSSRKEKNRHKEGRKKDGNESLSPSIEILKDKGMETSEVVKEQTNSQKDNIAEMKNGEGKIEKNKNKKGRRDEEAGDFKGKKETTATEKARKVGENYGLDVSDKVEKKKRKRRKTECKDDSGDGVPEMMVEELGKESTMIKDKDCGDRKGNARSTRKKSNEIDTNNGKKGNRKKPNSVETGSEDPKPKANSKKVRFSGHVEVFPSSDCPGKGKKKNQEEGLVQGKRFSPEEDEIIKESVFNYIQAHHLGEQGLDMILHCKSYPELKNCWKEIGAAFPHRPYVAVYYRAHILFERDEKHEWTPEDLEHIQNFHKEHGPKWKELAKALGKHRVHLKDTWRRIKLPNRKKGHWSQDEYQTLFDLVNTDLQMKAFEEKKTKHGMLRDNISWTAISDKLSTRTDAICCTKWYKQLTSPMVAEGIWADADDYRLLDVLFNLDACCIEDVDWDNLLEHRSGDVCRRRWSQMVSHIGEHGNKSFAEQVEILSERYSPDLLEAREAWDNKPAVD